MTLQDELAEGQIASPGYTGTNHELSMESYDFDLYEYWDDVEYGDDAYWEYGLPDKTAENGQKRKRVAKAEATPSKRRKTAEVEQEDEKHRDLSPMVFMSREERNRRFLADPPILKGKKTVSLLPDWRRRFRDADGVVVAKKMPAAMRNAAEAQDEDTPPRKGHVHLAENGDDDDDDDDDDDEEEGDWEDDEEEQEAEGGIALDPEMLQTILREKLGAAGLGGADEGGFMQAIQQMMSGQGDEDATGDLANALLGKLTSQGGDEALSGWLSQQGVDLEDGDEASSVATEELPEAPKPSAAGRRSLHQSPPDSAIGMAEANSSGRKTTQMPLHSSPTSSSKKRSAAAEETKPVKKAKKVQFDVPPSTSPDAIQGASNQDDLEIPMSDDPLMSEATLERSSAGSKKSNAVAAKANKAASDVAKGTAKNGRKRKASSPDADGGDEKAAAPPPAKKKTRSRELQALGADAMDVPSPAPPARRTRSKANK